MRWSYPAVDTVSVTTVSSTWVLNIQKDVISLNFAFVFSGIRTTLMESEEGMCVACQQAASPESIYPNLSLRLAITNFKSNTGYIKSKRRKTETQRHQKQSRSPRHPPSCVSHWSGSRSTICEPSWTGSVEMKDKIIKVKSPGVDTWGLPAEDVFIIFYFIMLGKNVFLEIKISHILSRYNREISMGQATLSSNWIFY